MSANLDLVRSIYADWERGDFSHADWADPDIKSVTIGGPEPSRAVGLREAAEGFRDFMSVWEGYRLHVDKYRELDEGRVLVLMRAGAGRGKMSGLELGQHGGGGVEIFATQDGNVTCW
jgi:hypothetical protein